MSRAARPIGAIRSRHAPRIVRFEPIDDTSGNGTIEALAEIDRVTKTDGELEAHLAEGVEELGRRLRVGTPAVYTRIQDDRLRLDPRTLLPGEVETLVAAFARALDG